MNPVDFSRARYTRPNLPFPSGLPISKLARLKVRIGGCGTSEKDEAVVLTDETVVVVVCELYSVASDESESCLLIGDGGRVGICVVFVIVVILPSFCRDSELA